MRALRYKPNRTWSDRAPAQLVCDAPTKSGDPTGTLDIRRSYIRVVEARWRKVASTLSEALGKRDVLGLAPDKITALPAANKLQALQAWVTDIISRSLLEDAGQWLKPMITTSYNRAVARAMRLTKSDARPSESTQTTNALWAFSVNELQGICDAVTQQVTRIAAEAILHRTKPLPLARLVQERVRMIGATRSGAMIELMVVKAFTTGTLDQFEAAGVAKVGLVPETIKKIAKDSLTDAPRKGSGPGSRISRKTGSTSLRTLQRIRKVARGFEAFSLVNVATAGDDDVCPICEGIEENNPYTIDEARSLIPAHPRCRCAFIPADEDDLEEDANPYHKPAGLPEGGQFTTGPGLGQGEGTEMLAPPKARQPLDPDFTRLAAEKVAKDLNYKGPINVVNEDRKFVLNGETMSYAGSVSLSHLEHGITLYTPHLTIQAVAGVTAHEIEHIKFEKALEAYRQEAEYIQRLPRNSVELESGRKVDVMKPDGGLREPYDKQFPNYTALHGAYHMHSAADFAESDGVSEYSAKYWRAYHAGKISPKIAMHETLAEMARVKYQTGKFPEHWFKGEKPGTGPRGGVGKKMQSRRAIWRNLYKVVADISK